MATAAMEVVAGAVDVVDAVETHRVEKAGAEGRIETIWVNIRKKSFASTKLRKPRCKTQLI
jgi:hypothetical protein